MAGKTLLAVALMLTPACLATPASAQGKKKLITVYPTNKQQCDDILTQVLNAVMDETTNPGMAVQHFLIGTQADKVLPEMCAKGNYSAAADFANAIVAAPTGIAPQEPRRNPGECFMGACTSSR